MLLYVNRVPLSCRLASWPELAKEMSEIKVVPLGKLEYSKATWAILRQRCIFRIRGWTAKPSAVTVKLPTCSLYWCFSMSCSWFDSLPPQLHALNYFFLLTGHDVTALAILHLFWQVPAKVCGACGQHVLGCHTRSVNLAEFGFPKSNCKPLCTIYAFLYTPIWVIIGSHTSSTLGQKVCVSMKLNFGNGTTIVLLSFI